MKNIRIFITFLILALTITTAKADDLTPPPPTIPPGTEGPTCRMEAIQGLNIRLAQLLNDPRYPQIESQLNSFRADLIEEVQRLAEYQSIFNIIFYDPVVEQTIKNNITLLKASIANLESDLLFIESQIAVIQSDLIRCALPMPVAPPPTPVLVPVLIPDPVPTTMPITTETEDGRPPVMVIPSF